MSHNEPEHGNELQSLRVGDLLIDIDQLRVVRGDDVVPLPRLSFDLLVALARAAPRVVSQEELMRTVWPGLVVGPETISQRVKLLRSALGDEPKAPRYIASLRSRGYQCVAPVWPVRPVPMMASDVSVVVPADTPREIVALAPPRPHVPRMVMLLGAAALLALLAAALLRDRIWAGREPGATPIPIAVLPFANPDGSEAGRMLAFGVAESVLHQLSNVADLSVIAWSSATGIAGEQDIHDIATQLKVAYVLQGSVQRDGTRLRVTARLVEAATEHSVWSLRLDQQQQDVFSIEDEIAAQVARALSVSVSPEGRARMRGQGTRNVEAYLSFLEGQDALSTWRSHETGIAAAHFDKAVQIDPQFARAIVMLVRARMRDAEYSSGPNQLGQMVQTRAELAPMIERALVIDPRLSEAYVERAYLRSFEDPMAAEQDYRKAIELTPSNARAHQQLAELLWDDRTRRAEVATLLDRARELDPIDPELEVLRALYLFYRFAKADEADLLLRRVLERNPDYVPALARHGEILLIGLGRPVEAIKAFESVLLLDPGADFSRRLLVGAYVAIGELERARRVANHPQASPVCRLLVSLAEHQVQEAASLAYAAIRDGIVSGTDQWAAMEAISLEARRSKNFAKAATAMDEALDVHWVSAAAPVLGPNRGLLGDVLTYAGMLRASGDEIRARALLQAAERAMDEAATLGGETSWNLVGRARAAAMKGDSAGALSALEQRCAITSCWESIEVDPLFVPLRSDPRFKILAENLQRGRDEARRALQSR